MGLLTRVRLKSSPNPGQARDIEFAEDPGRTPQRTQTQRPAVVVVAVVVRVAVAAVAAVAVVAAAPLTPRPRPRRRRHHCDGRRNCHHHRIHRHRHHHRHHHRTPVFASAFVEVHLEVCRIFATQEYAHISGHKRSPSMILIAFDLKFQDKNKGMPPKACTAL